MDKWWIALLEFLRTKALRPGFGCRRYFFKSRWTQKAQVRWWANWAKFACLSQDPDKEFVSGELRELLSLLVCLCLSPLAVSLQKPGHFPYWPNPHCVIWHVLCECNMLYRGLLSVASLSVFCYRWQLCSEALNGKFKNYTILKFEIGWHPEKLGGLSRHPSPLFPESAPSLCTAYPSCMCCLLVSDYPGYQTDCQGITAFILSQALLDHCPKMILVIETYQIKP